MEGKREKERGGYGLWVPLWVCCFTQIHLLKKIKKKPSGLITFKSLFSTKQPVFLLVRTGRSISMESKCVNTNCQITASIIESYTLVLTSNQVFFARRDYVNPLSLTHWQGCTCKYGLPDYLQSAIGWSLSLCIHAAWSTLKLVTHNAASSSRDNAAGITLSQLSW